ncbi:MAG: hypothetical protein MRZ79_23265 [Bacteroidia bacterium]|nr:hypothetical protein [Bacteroidia bacterium]
MATGKLSNRQKMINVMYLALLAMLALQVDIDVLNSFIRLKGQIRKAGIENREKNLSFASFMKQKIDDQVTNEGKTENVGLKDTLDLLEKRTIHLISAIDKHISELEVIAAFDPETGEYEAKEETEKNYQYWLGNDDEANGNRGNGKAIGLRDSMNEYFGFLANVYNSQVSDSQRILPSLLEDPSSGLGLSQKSWEKATFEGPVIANVTSLEAFKLDVYQRQKEVLDLLNIRLGSPTNFQPDSIIPFSAPVARIVPAGVPFETKIMVGMINKNITPQFSSPNGSIKLEENGNVGTLTIAADGRHIASGETEGLQSYTATVKVPKATGGFETLTLKDNFVVRKPEVLVYSASVQQLYRNCGNKLNISAPALGEYYFPKVTAQGAEVRKKQGTRSVYTVVPSGRTCVLDIKSSYQGRTVELDKIKYRVIEPPKPEVRFKINGVAYNGYKTIPKNSRLTFWLKPDSDFKTQLPKDARYEVSSIDILFGTGISVPSKIASIDMRGKDATKPTRISLPARVRQAPSGSRVYVVINKVYRKNFMGRKVEVPMSELVKTVGFSIR